MNDPIQSIVDLVTRSRVKAVRVTAPGLDVLVRQRPHAHKHDEDAARVVVAQARPAEPPASQVIRSRRVGIFRHLDPPVSVGDAVQPGQTVGIIESMRIPSDVRCESSGIVIEVLVEDGAPVEFDQPLFVLSTPQNQAKGGSQ